MPHTEAWEAERHHLLLHHDQHENILAACFSLDRARTGTKQRKKKKNEKNEKKDVARGVRSVGGPPLSVHRMQFTFWRAAGGRLRQTGRKDQPQRSLYTHTHTHTSVCIFSHNGQQHRDVIWLPTCRTKQESVKNEIINMQKYNNYVVSNTF